MPRSADAVVADRLRIWEVRRFCQVTPALVTYGKGTGQVESSEQAEDERHADGGLTALIRCLIYLLQADVAMVSLLDETTQYFVAGATAASKNTADVSMESAQWYGCDSVLHAGGLCNRTIQSPDIYEELDMAHESYTRDLPFVNGELASFRYYAGAPITTQAGYNIGTVFIFRKQLADQGLSAQDAQVLKDTATQVMRQLELRLRAIEGQRLTDFNTRTAMLNRTSQNQWNAPNRFQSPKDAEIATRRIYEDAANMLLELHGFSAVVFQRAAAHYTNGSITSGSQRLSSGVLATTERAGVENTDSLPVHLLDKVQHIWPDGKILHRADETFMCVDTDTISREGTDLQTEVCQELANIFPQAQQLLLNPIWDSAQNRIVSVAVGWAVAWARVYTTTADLAPMTWVCQSALHTVRRLEAQYLDQVKSDFLGSVSHEMRTPLHGNLANIELALRTQGSEERRDMLDSALACGNELLDTIDRILEYSQISTNDIAGQGRGRGDRGSVEPQMAGCFQETSQSAQRTDLCQLSESLMEQVLAKTTACYAGTSERHERTFDLGGDSPYVVFDADTPRRLRNLLIDRDAYRTIFSALMSNAVKFTPSGCIRVSLELHPRPNDTRQERLVLKVADTGRGMSSTYLSDHLFMPFSQSEPLDPGMGLGLPLVKRKVESLGGSITVESDLDQGTTVTVGLDLPDTLTEDTGQCALTESPSAVSALPMDSGIIRAQLLASERTQTSFRTLRCAEMLQASLERCLTNNRIQLERWNPDKPPDIIIAFHRENEDGKVADHDLKGSDWIFLGRDQLSTLSKSPGEGINSPLQSSIGRRGPLWSSRLEGALKLLRPRHFGLASAGRFATGHQDAATETLRPGTLPGTEGYVLETKSEAHDTAVTTGLPAGDKACARSPDSQPGSNGEGLSSDAVTTLSPLRVLLVDDNEVNLKVLDQFVQKSGVMRRCLARNGQQAVDAFLEAVSTTPIDLIFMDLSMPVMSGIQATAVIRSIEAQKQAEAEGGRPHQAAVIVALTGLSSQQDKQAAFEAGVDRYVLKPTKLKDVQAIVDTCRQVKGT